jgi:exodeoxyribonuclease VII small subunit
MSQGASEREIAEFTFEEALSELEAIVRRLEEGTGTLDESISAYERGTALKRHCEKKLDEAQSKIEKIVVGSNGSISSEPAKLD